MYVLRFHPGETIVLNFLIPAKYGDVEAVGISFRNQRHVAFEAVTTSYWAEGDKIRVGYNMTQQESLLFEENAEYEMQVNVYGPLGSRLASSTLKTFTGPQHIQDTGINTFGLPISSVESSDLYGQYRAVSGKYSFGYDYNELVNKPQVNAVTLRGDRNLPENRITNEQIDQIADS